MLKKKDDERSQKIQMSESFLVRLPTVEHKVDITASTEK